MENPSGPKAARKGTKTARKTLTTMRTPSKQVNATPTWCRRSFFLSSLGSFRTNASHHSWARLSWHLRFSISPRKATTLVFIRWSLDNPSAPITVPRRPSCNTRVLRISFSSRPSAVSSWSDCACRRTTVPKDVSKARIPGAGSRGVRTRTPTIIFARRSAAVRDLVRVKAAGPAGPSPPQPSAGKLLYFPAVRPLLSVCVLWKFLDSGALRTGAVMAGISIGT
mmetsp:Transcript_32220/g.83579  ORF Transcript_32220/g.83579 Transcript_32220/m.83579 type:complete len:224 (+) Transcript_32220:2366-3037(+)